MGRYSGYYIRGGYIEVGGCRDSPTWWAYFSGPPPGRYLAAGDKKDRLKKPSQAGPDMKVAYL